MELKFKNDDFQSFEPVPYLDEYFNYPANNHGGVGVENEEFLRFFAQAAHEYALDDVTLLDFGCGPTIYSVISLGRACREVHLSDYLSQNLAQVGLWQQDDSKAFAWTPYLRRALQLESNIAQSRPLEEAEAVPEGDIAQRAALLRKKITRIVQGNARATDPVGETGRKRYEAVVSSFCLEGVAHDLAEWKQLLVNLTSTLQPGGLLVFATQIETDSYRIGEGIGKVVNLNEQDIVDALVACGFVADSIKTEELQGAPDHTEYDKFLMLTARLAV